MTGSRLWRPLAAAQRVRDAFRHPRSKPPKVDVRKTEVPPPPVTKRRDRWDDGCWFADVDGCFDFGCDIAGCDLFVLGTVVVALVVPFRRAPALAVPAVMRPGPGARPSQRALLAALRWYKRRASGAFGARCRYTPSCSAYAAEAVSRHGARGGIRLARARLRRCRPGGGRGYDPVPSVTSGGRFPAADLRNHLD